MKPFNYFSCNIPDEYICSKCKKRGMKLWREASTFNPRLFCANCLASKAKVDISSMNNKGFILSEFGETDQFGGCVPAIPDEEGIGYWGYSSVPNKGITWWEMLPNQ